MLITLKQKKKQVVEVCEKTVYGEKQSFIEWTYVVDAHWNCLYEMFPLRTQNVCLLGENWLYSVMSTIHSLNH